MLSLKFVRENFGTVRKLLEERGVEIDLSEFLECDGQRRQLLGQAEALRQERNKESQKVADLKRRGEDASSVMVRMRKVGARIKELEEKIKACDENLRNSLLFIPNMIHESVPRGRDESDNKEVKRWGDVRKFDFNPRPHWEIGEILRILDFERASKITGARFALYMGAGARLERALINFMLDLHTSSSGYMEVLPPFMVNRESLLGTGQLPKFEDDLFRLKNDDYYLVPTAEVPLTNIHRDEILPGETLPICYTAYTPCFRREAGSYGKDTRGLIRQHQFNKVELVRFVRPESSYNELEKLLNDAEEVLVRLNIPYRVVTLCSGDLGFASAKTYDIEAWLPGQGVYREISSCSNFESYQARRANIRFRPSERAKPDFVHTLNGSGLAVGRTVVAILENYQQPDGTVKIPEALVSYMNGQETICPPEK